MATIEERLAHLEYEHAALKNDNAELKKAIELHTIALGALVNKATLERLNEKYDKIFDALISHDQLTNERLRDIQTQVIELDGKIVGLQTEMRQGFDAVNVRSQGIETEMRQGFDAVNARSQGIETEMHQGFDAVNARFDQIMILLTALAHKPEQEK